MDAGCTDCANERGKIINGILKSKRHAIFLACCAGAALLNWRFLGQLLDYSSKYEFASHIFMIPVISTFLIFRKREKIFEPTHGSPVIGINLCLAAGIVLLAASLPSIKALAMVALFNGLFLACYGTAGFRKALFPLLFLILMVPVPESLIQHVIAILQKGSAEMVSVLFSLTGTTFHREDLTFILPKIAIQIAAQCSGIRSSVALLISCLLAAHLILTKPSRRVIFVLVAIPMAMFKNALRIAALSLLAIHVDARYIAGSDLHRKGGIVFFVATLLLMLPILWLLKRSEKA